MAATAMIAVAPKTSRAGPRSPSRILENHMKHNDAAAAATRPERDVDVKSAADIRHAEARSATSWASFAASSRNPPSWRRYRDSIRACRAPIVTGTAMISHVEKSFRFRYGPKGAPKMVG